jgi:hypothetical protein
MYKTIIIIMLSIILYVLLFSRTDIVNETYDGRISNINSSKDCAETCTTTYGCEGFGYDDKEKKCYISKVTVLGYPIDRLYSPEYKSHQYSCNKVRLIRTPEDVNPDSLMYNRVYSCADNGVGKYNLKFFDKGKEPIDIGEEDVDKMKREPYDMNEIEWPTKRKDIVFGEENKSFDTRKTIFIENSDEYLGKYLYNHKCVANIDKRECVKKCREEDKCIGFEWNPKYINEEEKLEYNNVCCPKTAIERKISRRPEFSNGLFYEKIKINDYDDLDTYIKIT